MENKVLINQYGIIEIHVVGDQNSSAIKDIGDRVISLTEKLRSKGSNIHILVDNSKMGKIAAEANRTAMHLLDLMPYDKVAIVGSSKRIKNIAKLVVMAAGQSEKVKLFDLKEDAVAWLYAGLVEGKGRK